MTYFFRSALALAVAIASMGAMANSYTILGIGPDKLHMAALNIKGEVLNRKGSIYRNGHWHTPPAPWLDAIGLNDNNDILAAHNAAYKIFPAGGGKPIVIKGLPNSNYVIANAFNNNRMVAGSYYPDQNGPEHCFLWATRHHWADIGGDSEESCLSLAINENGEVAGIVGADTMFEYQDGVLAKIDGQGFQPEPFAIDRKGNLAGRAFISQQPHAFYWDGVVLTILESSSFNSEALGMNNHGVIVGFVKQNSQDEHTSAVRFTLSGVVNLESEVVNIGGWQLFTALAVNDKGQILGEGYDEESNRFGAFLLTPVGAP